MPEAHFEFSLMSVPFIDLKRYETGFLSSWNEKIAELTRDALFIGGREVAAFEKSLCQENDVEFAIGCANGTDAIQLALRASGVGRGDIVLIPDSTFWATFEAVVNVNADPVVVDINRADLQMDFDLFKQAGEKYKPKAAILVHLYGWGSGKLDEYRAYCKDKKIILIEDGAQAYGVQWKGNSIYKNAEISTISFYPAKVLGAAGDAGAVLTSSSVVAERLRSLANHGREEHYAHGSVGWNSRLSSLQAAFLNLTIPHLQKRLLSRRHFAQLYRERLKDKGILTISPPAGYQENGYLNVCLFEKDKRAKIMTVLKEKGIGFGNVYPGAVSDQKGAGPYLKGQVGGENARWLSESVLNLPLFAYMTDEEFEEVITVLVQAQ